MTQFPYGEIVPVPEGFAPPEAWSEYGLLAEPLGFCAREEVGSHPKGVRWSAWPLTFEEYVSDEEPSMATSAHGSLARNRAITWKRIARADVPQGWRVFSQKPWRIDGFRVLEQGDYTTKWYKNARREVRLWREEFLNTRYTIEDISWSEFEATYLKSTTAPKAGLELLRILGRKLMLPSAKHITLWGVRNKKSGALIAGTAALYSPSRQASVRYCPFMLSEAKHCYASTGLVDHWFAHSQRQGVRYQTFTCFPTAGDPRGWRGPAEFKSHFGLKYVAYPPTLYRFAPGKFF